MLAEPVTNGVRTLETAEARRRVASGMGDDGSEHENENENGESGSGRQKKNEGELLAIIYLPRRFISIAVVAFLIVSHKKKSGGEKTRETGMCNRVVPKINECVVRVCDLVFNRFIALFIALARNSHCRSSPLVASRRRARFFSPNILLAHLSRNQIYAFIIVLYSQRRVPSSSPPSHKMARIIHRINSRHRCKSHKM